MSAKPKPADQGKPPTTVTLRIRLERPTAGVDFGLQEGHGHDVTIVQKQRSTGADLEFEFIAAAKSRSNDPLPTFTGPFVQGPSGDKFVYINIGTYAGQINTPWSRRLKIPLSGISWELIDSEQVLLAEIPGTGKDGGPSCAYEWRRRVDPSWAWQPLKKKK
jgi:hypothetical protein